MNYARLSDNYREMQQALHETGGYGVASIHYAPLVTQIIEKLEVTHVLDYGCGSAMNLGKAIKPKHKLQYQAYDPCVPDLAGDPVPAQLVCCIDVLEHIEPEYLENVLDHIASLTEVAAVLTIHCGPALKKLADGRNAHLIQEPMEWWLPKIWSRFDIQTVQKSNEKAFHVIAYAKPRLESPDGAKLV